MNFGKQRLSILIYHRVLPRPDSLLPGLPDVKLFNQQMALLKRWFRVIPLSVAARHLQRGTLPDRAACITFDDGYADNFEYALPVLRRHGLSATIFIASGYLNGGQMWNDDVIDCIRHATGDQLDMSSAGCGLMPIATLAQKRQAVDQVLGKLKYLSFAERLAISRQLAPPRHSDLMMRSDQVEALAAAGMEIGAHTMRHPILSRISDDDARTDIADGKAELEAIIQKPVTLFAYPNGKPGRDYDQRHVEMVRMLGFEAAVSTSITTAHAASDLLQLPRFTPWEQDRPRFLLKLLASRLQTV